MDRNDETPGCLARRLGQTKLYETIKNHGICAELLLNYVERTKLNDKENNNNEYLQSELQYDDTGGKLVNEQGAPVMMKWETEIMKETAKILLPTMGKGRVLNIGYGMGIIDGFLQERKPESHVIVEAHATVIQRMKDEQWYKKPGVQVHIIFPFNQN